MLHVEFSLLSKLDLVADIIATSFAALRTVSSPWTSLLWLLVVDEVAVNFWAKDLTILQIQPKSSYSLLWKCCAGLDMISPQAGKQN